MSARVHDARHERLLHEAVTADEAEVPAELAACPTCRDALDELRDVKRLLDETAREERDALEGLDWSGDAPGADLVAPFLRERFNERSRRPMVRGRAMALRFTAAAAALLTFGWVAREIAAPAVNTGGPRVLLGQEGLGQLAPSGEVRAFGPFSWSFRENPDGWYVVRVLGPDARLRGESGQLAESRWQPSAEELAAWPDAIVWTVSAYDASGALVGSNTARASRR